MFHCGMYACDGASGFLNVPPRPYGRYRYRGGYGWNAGQRDWQKNGGEAQNRTVDTGIFSPLLYRLSYLATECRKIIRHRQV